MKKTALLLLLLATASGLAYASQDLQQPLSDDLAEYHNDRFGFSFLYPADLIVEEADHNNGLDITFGNDETGEAFVLVIVPFSQYNVQHPSEPIQSATSFDESETLTTVNVVDTDVTQYWFIHNNAIYQFVAMPDEKEHIINVLRTWHFL